MWGALKLLKQKLKKKIYAMSQVTFGPKKLEMIPNQTTHTVTVYMKMKTKETL